MKRLLCVPSPSMNYHILKTPNWDRLFLKITFLHSSLKKKVTFMVVNCTKYEICIFLKNWSPKKHRAIFINIFNASIDSVFIGFFCPKVVVWTIIGSICIVPLICFYIQYTLYSRGIRTNAEFILWTEMDFCVMHFANFCIKFCQKLQIRGSGDLVIFSNFCHILSNFSNII